jgi:hypothetical protein
MYPAVEINLRLDHVCAAEPSSLAAFGYASRRLYPGHQPAPPTVARSTGPEVQGSPKSRWSARVEPYAITLATCRSSVNVAMRAVGTSAGTSGERRPASDARRRVPV